MATAAEVVEKARSQIGTLIGTPGVPYAVPFSCAKFTSWDLGSCGLHMYDADSPNDQYVIAQQRSEFGTTPQVGDLVFIDLFGKNNQWNSITHVSILVTVDGMTIEFNDPEGGPNAVRYRQRGPVGDGFTIGYAHPPYEKGPTVVAQRYHIPNVFVDLRVGLLATKEPWAIQLGEDGGIFAEGGPFHGSESGDPAFIGPSAVLHVAPDGSMYTIENTAGQLYRPDGGHPFRMINGLLVPA